MTGASQMNLEYSFDCWEWLYFSVFGEVPLQFQLNFDYPHCDADFTHPL